MTTKSEIMAKKEKINQIRDNYKDDIFGVKLFGYTSLISVAGLSYLGLRYIFGGQPDISFLPHYLEPRTFIQKIDDLMMGCIAVSSLLVPMSLLEFWGSLSTKKEIRKQESELKVLIKDYKFSHGID